MSLVGTRPPTVDEWEKYELHHRSRMSTKPGITGMWQVSGRSDITDFEEVVRLDTEYMDSMKSLHIQKRGDYLNSHYAATLAVCDDLYYKKAIEIIEKEIKNPEFFVFTNTHVFVFVSFFCSDFFHNGFQIFGIVSEYFSENTDN